MNEIFAAAAAEDIEIAVALHLLYDLAARVQDLLAFTYERLAQKRLDVWKMQKTKVKRKGAISLETIDLLQ